MYYHVLITTNYHNKKLLKEFVNDDDTKIVPRVIVQKSFSKMVVKKFYGDSIKSIPQRWHKVS